jgi:hypothetical protein
MPATSRNESGQPGQRLVENRSVERVMDELPMLRGDHQVRLPEQIKVIGYARKADGEMFTDLTDTEIAFPQKLQDASARRIAQSAEELGLHI